MKNLTATVKENRGDGEDQFLVEIHGGQHEPGGSAWLCWTEQEVESLVRHQLNKENIKFSDILLKK